MQGLGDLGMSMYQKVGSLFGSDEADQAYVSRYSLERQQRHGAQILVNTVAAQRARRWEWICTARFRIAPTILTSLEGTRRPLDCELTKRTSRIFAPSSARKSRSACQLIAAQPSCISMPNHRWFS